MKPEHDNARLSRRAVLALSGLSLAGLGAPAAITIPSAKAQDMSNGANNFYTSDRLTLQKVAFRNQYRMNVAGNLFPPTASTGTHGARRSWLGTRWAR
jgi:hypothetical protein